MELAVLELSPKKAETEYGVNTGMKGADAILRIAIGIIMKPKTRVEVEAYYDQMKDKVDNSMEVGEASRQHKTLNLVHGTEPATNIAKGTLKKHLMATSL